MNLFCNYKFCVYGYNNSDYYNYRRRTTFTLFLVVIMAVYYILCSDFFRYQRLVQYGHEFTFGAINHMEDIYGYIILLCDRSYMLFRLVVFGGTFIIVYFTYSRFTTYQIIPFVFLSLTLFTCIAYARASFAMAIYFFGLSFLCKPLSKNSLLGYVLGCLLIVFSYQFHHSMIVMICITPVIFFPINKKLLSLSIVGLPLLFIVLSNVFNDLISIESNVDESLVNKASGFVDVNGNTFTLQYTIRTFLNYAAILGSFVVATYSVFYKKRELTEKYLKLYKIIFAMVVVSFSTLLFGMSNIIFFYRFLYMVNIPVALLAFALLEEDCISNNCYARLLNIGVAFELVTYLYGAYLSFTNQMLL